MLYGCVFNAIEKMYKRRILLSIIKQIQKLWISQKPVANKGKSLIDLNLKDGNYSILFAWRGNGFYMII